jgi:hypothetical protein
MLQSRRNQLIAAILGLAVLGAVAGTGYAIANGGDDEPLTGETYDRAVAAALAQHPGAEVTETEVGDGDAAFEVELRLVDGSQAEVQLDEGFNVLGSEPDDDGPGGDDDDGADDD